MTIQERIAYINARKDLLQFFFEHMYSNNTEEDKELVLSIFPFNSKNDAFLNDMERMKYFIDRFNQYYNEETYMTSWFANGPMQMSITRVMSQTPLSVHTFMRY